MKKKKKKINNNKKINVLKKKKKKKKKTSLIPWHIALVHTRHPFNMVHKSVENCVNTISSIKIS